MDQTITVKELREMFPDKVVSDNYLVRTSDWWFVKSWSRSGGRSDGIKGKRYTDVFGHYCGGLRVVREYRDNYQFIIKEK